VRHIRRAIALTLAALGGGGGASRDPGAAPEPARSSTIGVRTMSLQLRRYHRQRLELVFVDRSGCGQWMLTPTSEAAFVRALRAALVP